MCRISQELLFEPVQTSCGHLFCGRCQNKRSLVSTSPSDAIKARLPLNQMEEVTDKLQKQEEDALLKTEEDLSPPKPWLQEDPLTRYSPCTVKLQQDKNGCFSSSHFTTHPGGYRLRIDFDNYSFLVCHVEGPRDDSLQWPIEIFVKCVVLNQKEDRQQLELTLSGFLTHRSARIRQSPQDVIRRLNNGNNYTQDGNMYIKVESVDIKYTSRSNYIATSLSHIYVVIRVNYIYP